MNIRAALITGTTIKHLGLALSAGIVLSMGTTSAAPVKWVGGGGNWDASTSNWLDPGSSPTTFTDGDDAIFDTGSGTITVALDVAPLSTTFDSGAGNYTLNSSAVDGAAGVITAGTLTKSGGSQLTLNGLNSFTGKTIIEGGTVQLGIGTPTGLTAAGVAGPLGAPAAGPDATIEIHDGVTLQMGSTDPRVDQTTDRTIDLAGTGGGTVTIRLNNNDTNFTFGAVTATGTGAKTLAVVTGFQGNGDREAVIINGPISDTADDKLGLQFTYNTQTDSQSYASLPGANTFTGPITLVKGNSVVTSYLTVGGLRTRNVTTPGSGSLGGGSYPGAITLGATTIFNYLSSASQTLSGAISGPGALNVGGGGTLTLDGACTYLGNTTVSGGSALILGTSGDYTFTITNSSSNKITGAGDATLNGTFTLDTSAVTASGGSWTLVDTATKPFGASFSMGGAGWMETANVWTKEVGASTWTFDEATGVLSLSSAAVFTSFSIPGASGAIDNNALTIQLYVPVGTDLSTLAPNFTVSSGTCDRTSGAVPSPQTFADANPLTYTITDTGPDPDVVNAYTVTITESPMIFSGLRVWLKADAINSGNPAEVDSGAIVQWLDSSGNGNDAANPASGDRPTYVAAGLNGLPVVRLTQDDDDNGDRLFLGDLSAQFPTAGSMFAVATLNTDGRYNIFDNRTNDSRWVADTWSESSPGVFRNGRTTFPAYASWPQSGSHIIAMESDSSAYTFVIDGDLLGTTGANYHNGAGQDWVIGNRPGGGQALNGDIAEFILFDRVLSPAEATQVGAYLANKYGLSTTYNPVVGGFDSFGIAGSDGVIDNDAKTISLAVPFGTDLATLAPDFTLTSGSCDQTSGSPPSPTFAAQNPATYTVTDGPTVNNFTVTVTVLPETATYVIDLGAGTVIEGSTSGTYGLGSLPLPPLPVGSILRKIETNVVLEATDNDNWASELAFLVDPTPGAPGGDYSLGISNGSHFGAATPELGWPGAADNGPVTPLVDTKTDADWSSLGDIDLNSSGVFLGNGYGGPTVGGTWSGTITLTYDVVGGASPYSTWAGGAVFDADDNGDGVANGLAWILGATDPNVNSTGLLPAAGESAGGLTMHFLRVADLGSATLSVEYSSDLGQTDPWHAAVIPATSGTFGGDLNATIILGDPDDVTLTIPAAHAAGGQLYGRLKASE